MFRRLLIATIVGILAAFAVAGFRHAMLLLEWLFLNNDSGSLVNAATNLSPSRRGPALRPKPASNRTLVIRRRQVEAYPNLMSDAMCKLRQDRIEF